MKSIYSSFEISATTPADDQLVSFKTLKASQDKAQLDMVVLLTKEEFIKNMHAAQKLHVESIQNTLSILFFSTRIISWGCGLKQVFSYLDCRTKRIKGGGPSYDTPKTKAPCNSRCSTVKTPTRPPLLPNLCPKLQIFTDNGNVQLHPFE